MNAYAPITEATDGNMTSKGQVLIPKALRDRVGLTPGAGVTIGIDQKGEIVVRPQHSGETIEERRARIRAQIASVRGTVKSSFGSTDAYMNFIRPHRLEDW